MEANKLENPIQPKTTRREEELEIFKSLKKDVNHVIFPLIEELFDKGVTKDEDLDLFKQELLRIVVTYLPYKKKLDQTYGKKEEDDIFTSEIKLMLENKLYILLDDLKKSKLAVEKIDGAEIAYNKLVDYISGLKVEKM